MLALSKLPPLGRPRIGTSTAQLVVLGEAHIAKHEALAAAKRGGKSVGNDYYLTGARILLPIREFGIIELDPCGACKPIFDDPESEDRKIIGHEPVKSLVFAEREYRLDRGEDGLALPWRVKMGNIWYSNPPYSQTRKWVEKADAEHKRWLSEGLMLIAARTGAKAIQAAKARLICFLDERLRFLDPETLLLPTDAKGKPTSAMFDSMVMYYGMREAAFRAAFEPYGKVVRWS